MSLKQPKVLVVSHNCFNDQSGMGKTLKSIFSIWDDKNISQMYFRNEIPNSMNCKNYFKLTDMDLIKSFLSRKKFLLNHTSEIKQDNVNIFEKRMYKIGGKRFNIIGLFRDLLWYVGYKYYNELDCWIDNCKPEILFFTPGDYIFSYKIALEIVEKKNLYLVLYFTDDYLNKKKSINPIYILKYFYLNKYAKKAIEKSSKLFVIGEMMAEEYEMRYGKRCTILSNIVTNYEEVNPIKELSSEEEIILSYIGSLHSNRWKGLIEIASVLDNLNSMGINARLDVYCAEKVDSKILNSFSEKSSLKFKGSLNGEEVKKIQMASDILVHVESFDKKYVNLTRLSVSTKISEYIVRGKCIFAFGPSSIASINYLKKNKIAHVCTQKYDLTSSLKQLLLDKGLRENYSNNAIHFAKENYNAKKCNEDFIQQLINIIE